MSELHFIIKPDGTIEIDAKGFSSTKCLEASQSYEKDLGTVINRKKKPEILCEGEGGVSSNGIQRNRIGN